MRFSAKKNYSCSYVIKKKNNKKLNVFCLYFELAFRFFANTFITNRNKKSY